MSRQWTDGEVITADKLNEMAAELATAAGPVAVDRLPVASMTDAGVVSLGQMNAVAASQVQQGLANAVSRDELFQSFYVTNMFNSSDTVGGFGSQTLMYAPYDLRVSRIVLIFDKWNQAKSAKDAYSITFRNWDPVTNSGPAIVTKSTSDEAVTVNTPWGYDTATWNPDRQIVPAGNLVRWSGTMTGTAPMALPVLITIGYVPQ